MPLEGVGCLLELVEILLCWSIYRWLIPVAMVVVGGIGLLGHLALAVSITLLVIGLAWLGFNIWKGFNEGDWGRESY